MSRYTTYNNNIGVHWEHLTGCIFVAGITVWAVFFDHIFWLYDNSLETERLLVALLLDRVSIKELFETAPPGQVIISFFVVFGDRAVGILRLGTEITHDLMRVVAAGYVTFECLRALIDDTDWSPSEAPRFYSVFFTVLVALGPFALLLSQMGVSSLLCLAISTPLLRVVFGLDLHRKHVNKLEPTYFLIIVSIAGWPGVALAFFLSTGCLIQSFIFRDNFSVLVSALTLLLGAVVSISLMVFGPGWPSPTHSSAIFYVSLTIGLPLLLVVLAFLAPSILYTKNGLQLTLPVIAILGIVALAIFKGGNLLLAVALLLLAYTGMWALHPSIVHSVRDYYNRTGETITAAFAWLIAPAAITATYALKSDADWNMQTIGFCALFWSCILGALAVFLRSPRNENGRRAVLVLTSVASVLFVGGVTSLPLREEYTPAPVALAQHIWSLCRDAETPPAIAKVAAGIDPLTQRRLGPARRGQIDGVDVLHIRNADAPKPENAIDLLQTSKPMEYIASIAVPTEAARARCGSGEFIE